jgi:hypothetical protein
LAGTLTRAPPASVAIHAPSGDQTEREKRGHVIDERHGLLGADPHFGE